MCARCLICLPRQEAEEAAQAKLARAEAHAAARAAAAESPHLPPDGGGGTEIVKSPSEFSCHSYELFVGQEKGHDDNNKEKMSIRSEGLDSVSEQRRVPTNSNNTRKVSTVSVLTARFDVRSCYRLRYRSETSYIQTNRNESKNQNPTLCLEQLCSQSLSV